MPETATLLSLRGVLDIVDLEAGTAIGEKEGDAVVASFDGALLMRWCRPGLVKAPGCRTIVGAQVDEIERLTDLVENAPARSVEAIRKRLADQVAKLIGDGPET